MEIINATSIKDVEQKNKLINYARSIGCRAQFKMAYNGLGIVCYTKDQIKNVNAKIKELKKEIAKNKV